MLGIAVNPAIECKASAKHSGGNSGQSGWNLVEVAV